MSYQVSEFEQKHINKIKKELEKYPNINTIEKLITFIIECVNFI